MCKKWKEKEPLCVRTACMCLCRPSVSPVGRSLDVSWGLMPCSPHIWAARLTRRPPEKRPLEAMSTSCPAGPLVNPPWLLLSRSLRHTHEPKESTRSEGSVLLCFGNTNVFGQLSQRTVPVIHKSERKERWIAGSKDSTERGGESKKRCQRQAQLLKNDTHYRPAGPLIK